MRLIDIRKAFAYLGRIAHNPFSRQSRAALVRYMGEGFSLIGEKIRGLDFTMVYQNEYNLHNNNYSKSPRKTLERVFDDIDFTTPHSFLDMGCGKGYVMTCASGYPFEKVGGVEYSAELSKICRKNLKILKLDRVNVFNCDAKDFGEYGNYDIYYFCNPFDETIISVVANRIMDSHKDNKCWIYYLNPLIEERQKAIRDAGFKLVKVIEDDNEKYLNINVYEN